VLTIAPTNSARTGLSQFLSVSLPTDAVDQGNNGAFFSSQYSPNANSRAPASISAPSYYITGQTRLQAALQFERGPLNINDYNGLQANDLTLIGGTISTVRSRCFRAIESVPQSDAPMHWGEAVDSAVAVQGTGMSRTSTPSLSSSSPSPAGTRTGGHEGAGRAGTGTTRSRNGHGGGDQGRGRSLQGFNFVCLQWDVEFAPVGTADMTFVVGTDALGTNSNSFAFTRIRHDPDGTLTDSANLTWSGTTTYGPTTQSIRANIRIDPLVDVTNITSDII